MGLARRWFDRRLGLALAITSTGLAAGSRGFSYVISRTIQFHGWRAAFLTVGVAALAIGLINLVALVRDHHGPVPEVERREASADPQNAGRSLAEALRTPVFWLYAASFSLVIFASVGCSFHLPALLSDRGASPVQVASAVGIGAAGSLFGRLISGIMLDRFSVRSVAAPFYIGQAIGILLLLGGMQGAEVDVMGYVIARQFSKAAYSRIYGACFAVTMTGTTVGPIAMAMVFDRTGAYDPGLKLFLLLPRLPSHCCGLRHHRGGKAGMPSIAGGCSRARSARRRLIGV